MNRAREATSVTPSVTGVPPELQELPQAALDTIHAACAGDWRRVELTGTREVVIHNQPQMRRITLPDVRPRRYRVGARSVAPRALAPEREPEGLPEGMSPLEAARLMATEFAGGIAASIRIELSDQVVNMPNALVDVGVAACRHPDRVEVDPSSAEKGAPRLRFHRGSTMAVAAFQNITLPYLIGVWVS
jgi:hypothetical protein